MRSATSRTWPTEPAAPVSSAAISVWTLSMTQTSGLVASSVASTVARSVSARAGTSSAPSGSRAARRRTWAADSSPVTYRTPRPARARLPSAIAVSVDLPMPGEPPSRTTEPGTTPPPSTRSSSPMPVLSRATSSARTSRSGTARPGAAFAPPPRAVLAGATSSTSVFQSEQLGHWPCHLAVVAPHVEQVKTERAIRLL